MWDHTDNNRLLIIMLPSFDKGGTLISIFFEHFYSGIEHNECCLNELALTLVLCYNYRSKVSRVF